MIQFPKVINNGRLISKRLLQALDLHYRQRDNSNRVQHFTVCYPSLNLKTNRALLKVDQTTEQVIKILKVLKVF